jgi:hypothetical protein
MAEEFDELKDKADSGELTQETLQQRLNEYSAALKAEFETQTKENPENVEEYCKDFFRRNVHSLAAQVIWLANNAESESVQLSAAKFGIGMALDEAKGEGDPIKDLLKSLQANDKKVAK